MKTLLLCFLLMFNAIVNLFFNFYPVSKSFCRITKEIHSSPPRKSFNYLKTRKSFNCLKTVQQNILIARMNFHCLLLILSFIKMSHCTKFFSFNDMYGNESWLFLLNPIFYKNQLLVAWWYVWKAKRTQRVNQPKIFVIFINHYIQKIRNPWETTEFVTYCHIINMIL